MHGPMTCCMSEAESPTATKAPNLINSITASMA